MVGASWWMQPMCCYISVGGGLGCKSCLDGRPGFASIRAAAKLHSIKLSTGLLWRSDFQCVFGFNGCVVSPSTDFALGFS